MEALDLNKAILRLFNQDGWTINKLARATEMTYSGAWQLLRRNDMGVQRLAGVSEAFQYNFFRELAEQLPYSAPDYSPKETVVADNSENLALKGRVKELEMELKVLREAIVLMRG